MIRYRVFDRRLGRVHEPEQLMGIDFDRGMVTLKNDKGYQFTRFFVEVLLLAGTGVEDCSKEPREIFEQDFVLVSPLTEDEKPFYGTVVYADGAFIVENPTMEESMMLFEETRPITIIGNTYSQRGIK